ncbi:MAG: glycosyltransferase family 4 protein [Rhodocyclaceae bacterium]|nr:glycosyltransferase family 4 protein [Rhodocyclaceae bacterium]
MTRPIRTLLFSTLYPSEARPIHGIFVETRLRELIKSGQVESKVVAPVPWFPLAGERFGEYGKFAATPRVECRDGIEVHHPRYFLPPRIGMNIAPHTLAMAALPVIRQLIHQGFDFDLIDAHYYYPDGVAAGIIARKLGKPFVVTARGTDLNLIPHYPRPRKLILDTAARAAASIGVCKALMDTLAELGGEPAKLHVFRNGVDPERFAPEPRPDARKRLGLPTDRRQLLSVGHLIERKGHHIAIEALPLLPDDIDLTIVGSGPDRAALESLAARLGVAARVRFAGQIPQTELKGWYSAADILLLCSSREGWANVLLEGMACGTPVVATDIWGTPEVVSTPDAGLLMRERSAPALTESILSLFTAYPTREAVRRHAEGFSWEQTTQDQLRLFRAII